MHLTYSRPGFEFSLPSNLNFQNFCHGQMMIFQKFSKIKKNNLIYAEAAHVLWYLMDQSFIVLAMLIRAIVGGNFV
jgi:hypothetical protein